MSNELYFGTEGVYGVLQDALIDRNHGAHNLANRSQIGS
jgi:hypothetical protein